MIIFGSTRGRKGRLMSLEMKSNGVPKFRTQPRMKSAWVITQEGPWQSAEVVGIISARKSASTIKEYIEWLYALLHYEPDRHLDLAKYKKQPNPYDAQYHTTNTGIPVGTTIRCGDNPFLVARLAKNVALTDSDGEEPVLKWTEPDRLVCDEHTPGLIVEKIPGVACPAPVH